MVHVVFLGQGVGSLLPVKETFRFAWWQEKRETWNAVVVVELRVESIHLLLIVLVVLVVLVLMSQLLLLLWLLLMMMMMLLVMLLLALLGSLELFHT